MKIKKNWDCYVPGCEEVYSAKGLCKKHYARNLRTGTPFEKETVVQNCSVEGCVNKSRCLGYCDLHYQRFKKTGDVGSAQSTLIRQSKICKVDSCDKKSRAFSYCGPHLKRFKEYGDPLAGPIKGRWKTSAGYIYLQKPEHPNATTVGRVFEHIVVMSEHIGRPLTKNENVHHKNGQRDDNRVENLELWSKGQPPGQRVSDKLRWALELIETYGNDPTIYEDYLEDSYAKTESKLRTH